MKKKKPSADRLHCDYCKGVLKRLMTSSEPEGIRLDGECKQCHRIYAVHKTGLRELFGKPT